MHAPRPLRGALAQDAEMRVWVVQEVRWAGEGAAGPGGNWRKKTCQEFAAHSGNVQCVAIGRRSFKVLATGGDDRKVLRL